MFALAKRHACKMLYIMSRDMANVHFLFIYHLGNLCQCIFSYILEIKMITNLKTYLCIRCVFYEHFCYIGLFYMS